MAAPKQTRKTKPSASKPAGTAVKADSTKSTSKTKGKVSGAKEVISAGAAVAAAKPAAPAKAPPLTAAAKAAIRAKSRVPEVQAMHAVVENLQPLVDGGRFPIKAVPGEIIEVTADIFRDGHEKCEAVLLFRKEGDEKWKRAPMEFVDNDQWSGKFVAYDAGNYEYTVEGRALGHSNSSEVPLVDSPNRYQPPAAMRVGSPLTEYSAWYEMWARSQGTDPNKSATFADMANRLPEIKDLGFDVLYLPPIHPIGVTKRKGANNSLVAKPGEPGCPYAIGNQHGGHKAVDPELGTLEECRQFFKTATDSGFTIALDFALNCSPDHPYVKTHPDWYYREKDGTIKCAENPPKKYEDVYPLNFFCQDRKNLWKEIKSIIEFWMDMGVTIFRVDNPHTKPFIFWEWMIREIKAENPEVTFLSEAFTRPKVMKRLAKIGFDMSYTYFTWRTNAAELREYLEELTQGPASLYMKPIFFPTTPDILPWHLQNATPAMFKIRVALAATLVGSYGIYNSYELCEGTPVPGKEEFTYSEKYQYKVWDWNRPGNIKGFIKTLNEIRRDNRALHHLKNLTFHDCNNPNILVYSKTRDENIILFAVNLDPHNKQGGTVSLNLASMGLAAENIYGLYDLLTHESFVWSGKHNFVELTPHKEVMHIFKIEKF
ncbi:MAG: alpha-1,4-glucan--maltose-1-phosphate maltosyltransferase [Fibrobacterota bacterium]|nr:alpha-1,4-glucan--maltose-1-phosphate maltosyltransferase [Fibrobacterota bacterium]